MVTRRDNAPWQPWVDTVVKSTVAPTCTPPAPRVVYAANDTPTSPRMAAAPYHVVQRERRLSNPALPSTGAWSIHAGENEPAAEAWQRKAEQSLSRSYYDTDYSAWESDTYKTHTGHSQAHYSPESATHYTQKRERKEFLSFDARAYSSKAAAYEFGRPTSTLATSHSSSHTSAVGHPPQPLSLSSRWRRSVGDLCSLPTEQEGGYGDRGAEAAHPPQHRDPYRSLARRHSSGSAPTGLQLHDTSVRGRPDDYLALGGPYERRAYSTATLTLPAPPMSPGVRGPRVKGEFTNDSTSVYESYQARRSYGVMRVRREPVYLSARTHNGTYEDYVVDSHAARRHVHSSSDHVYERCRIARSEFCLSSPVLGRRSTPPIGEEASSDSLAPMPNRLDQSRQAPAQVRVSEQQPIKREEVEPKAVTLLAQSEEVVQNEGDEFENDGDAQGNESDDGVYFKIPRGVTCIEQIIDQWQVGDGPRCPALKDWTVEMRRKERSIYSQRKKLYEEYLRCGSVDEFYRIYKDMPIGKVYAAVSNRNRRARREHLTGEKVEP